MTSTKIFLMEVLNMMSSAMPVLARCTNSDVVEKD